MATAYEKRGASTKINIGTEYGGHHGGTDAHLSGSTQGVGQTVGGGGGPMPMAGMAASGGVAQGVSSGWKISNGCACLLAVIFFFIILFIFWWLIFNCLPVSWCCDKKTQKKDCCRVLWSAFIAAFISLLIIWLICYVCGRG